MIAVWTHIVSQENPLDPQEANMRGAGTHVCSLPHTMAISRHRSSLPNPRAVPMILGVTARPSAAILRFPWR